MSGCPTSKREIIEGLIDLHLKGIPLRVNAIAKADPHLFFALYDNNQKGGRKYKSLNHARLDVSERLRNLGRFDDATKVVHLNLTSVGSQGYSTEKINKIKKELIKILITKKEAGEDIRYRAQQQIDRPFAGKGHRYFEGWDSFLNAASIDPASVQRIQKLPLEAYLCILYDMQLEKHPLDGPSVAAAAPDIHQILTQRCKGYYNALSKLESLLSMEGRVAEAIKCNPEYLKKQMRAQRAHEREIKSNAPGPDIPTIDSRQPYGWQFFSKYGLKTNEQIVGGSVIIDHIEHSNEWFTPEQVALLTGTSATSICRFEVPKYAQNVLRVHEGSKIRYFLSKEVLDLIRSSPRKQTNKLTAQTLQDIARDLRVTYSIVRKFREELGVGTLTSQNRPQYVLNEQEEKMLRSAITQDIQIQKEKADTYEKILSTKPQWTPAELTQVSIPAMHFYAIARKRSIPPKDATFSRESVIQYFRSRYNYLLNAA